MLGSEVVCKMVIRLCDVLFNPIRFVFGLDNTWIITRIPFLPAKSTLHSSFSTIKHLLTEIESLVIMVVNADKCYGSWPSVKDNTLVVVTDGLGNLILCPKHNHPTYLPNVKEIHSPIIIACCYMISGLGPPTTVERSWRINCTTCRRNLEG